jgi:hypothetical protein
MNLNVTEIDSLNDDVEDVGSFDENGLFTPTMPRSIGSRVPQPRITTMAYKNRGVLNINKPQQKQVTYDDILSSLNMKVVDGKLQIVRNTNLENMKSNPLKQPQEQQYQQPQKKYQQFQPEKQQQQVPIMTKQQYVQMVAAHNLKLLRERQRIQEIKSTKLLFSNPVAHTNINISQNRGDLNRLFRFQK